MGTTPFTSMDSATVVAKAYHFHSCSSKEGNMKKKIIAFSFIVWAIAAISSPRPANAWSAIPLPEGINPDEITEVITTGKPVVSGSFTLCNTSFSFLQFMTIAKAGTIGAYNGTVGVYSDQIYAPGPQLAYLVGGCLDEDNITYYIYELTGF